MAKVIFVGLDAAGKTTITYKMKLDEVMTTIPTIGFNVEKIPLQVNDRKIDATLWDLGLRGQAKHLLRHYLTNDTSGVICVIDSTDPDRLEEFEVLLNIILEADGFEGIPVVFMLNKQDLAAEERVTEKAVMALPLVQRLAAKSEIAVFPVSGVTGMGLQDSMTWLGEAMVRKNGLLIKSQWGIWWLYDSLKRILCFRA